MQTGMAIISRKGYKSEAEEAVSIDPQRGKLNCTWKLGFLFTDVF
jgi:CTP-dependent riboflavin kinase